MSPRRVGRHLSGGRESDEDRERREHADRVREVFSFWASGVTVLAVRDGRSVHALTASALMPLSVEPPLVAVGLGGNAAILPFLDPGGSFAISILTADQRPLASRYADSFPVGPSPFPEEGDPIVEGALAALVCSVEELLERGDHTLVLGQVTRARTGERDAALVYYRRDYHRLA